MFSDPNTQLIQFTDQQKGTKNVTCTIYRLDKNKVKKSTGMLELNFSKTLQYKQCLCILTLPKYNA